MMQPDRWERIQQLCQDVEELNPDDRAAFLDQACAGEESLRSEVESLLACRSGFIETPALHMAARELAKEVLDYGGTNLADLTGQTLLH
jgi:hypothetical protein